MKLEVRILGVLEVRADGRDLKLRSAKQRELLAVLLLHQGQVVSRDRLVDALWGEAPPDTATKALQVHVSQLRKAQVGVETQAPGYLLRLDGDAVDSKRFERLAREGAAALAGGEAERAADLLREALALWRGPPLADFGSAEFAQPEIARLEELRVSAVENRIEADLALGRGDVVGELEALIASQPFRERLRRQLMLALYQGGRQAEALAAYRETHRVLAEELGIDPSAELQELERAILTQDPRLASPRPHARTGGDVFIGRDAELGVLLARLDAVIAGRGGVLLLAGEAGIGKSRLTDELSRRASTRGVLTLAGPCWEAGGAPPFWPWIRALRTYVRACPPGALGRQAPADLDELAGLLPELNVLGHGSSRPRASDPDEARFRLFDAAASFLRTAATDRPILLVLDDVHAADAPSLLLLRFLAHQLGDARLLVIAAYRNGEVGPGHPLAPAELERAVGTTRIELGGFTVADVERSLTLAAGPELAGGAAPQIHAATDGNPLFVTEIARLLVAEGRLDDPHDPDGLVRPVPLGVRGVIGRRLLRLSPGCRELLATAAVLGREFAHSTLERLAVASRDDVLDAMEEAAAAHVVEPLGGGRLRFTHALVRDSLYDDLAPARRLRTHRDAGTVLERLYAADPEPHLAELAYHFCAAANAGSAVRAADYAQRAAARAAGQLAYEEAARLYALALSVLEREAPEDAAAHCRLLLRFGDAQMRGGESAAARTIFLRVARIAARAGLAELQAEAALAYIGRFLWMRSISDPHLVPLIREALEALGGLEHPLRAKLKARLVPAVRGDLDWAPRAKLGEEAVRMARRLGDPATLAYVLDARCGGLEGPFTLEQTLADAEEIIALGERLGDDERVFAGLDHRLWARWTAGDMRRVAADRDAMARLADELRQPAQRWLVAVIDAALASFGGRFEQGERLIEQAYRIGVRAQVYSPGLAQGLQLLALRAEQGRLPEVQTDLSGWIRRSPGQRIFHCVQLLHHARLGRSAEAAEALQAIAADGFAGISPDEQWHWGAALTAEACTLLGDTERGAALYERLRPSEGQIVICIPEVAAGSASRWLGVLATLLERWDDASRHFEAALEQDLRVGACPAAAHDHHEHGRMLVARGRRADRARAQELLGVAKEEYGAMGMWPWARAAEEDTAGR